MTIRAVIFDLDGTIVVFNIDFRAVRAEVRSFLISAGVPASVLSINESIFEMLKKTEIFMKNNEKTQEAIQKTRAKALGIAEKFEYEAAKTTTLLPGVLETLKTLKKMNVKSGLCTNNSEKTVNYILNRFKIADYFDVVTTRNKVKNVKPSSEHLETTLNALNVNPNETVVVGDARMDMIPAQELKAIAVGLATEASLQKELISSGADYIITTIADLPILMQRINKTSKP